MINQGILIRISSMPMVFQWLTYFNYLRFGITSSLIDIYGLGRCADQSLGNVNQTHWTDLISAEQMLQIYSSDQLDPDALVSTVDSLVGNFGNISDNRSIVFKSYGLYDQDYPFSILMLFIHIIVYRLLTYLIILRKIDLNS